METRIKREGEDEDWDNQGQRCPEGTETDKGDATIAVMCFRKLNTPDRVLYVSSQKETQTRLPASLPLIALFMTLPQREVKFVPQFSKLPNMLVYTQLAGVMFSDVINKECQTPFQ